jgi:asparagine synthase (glutamine-hydrolysing)
MRNQLLRDADWAGMAHNIEIRVPLVDSRLLAALTPSIAGLKAGTGKAALAKAPTTPLPTATVLRAKTGFGVPTGAWISIASAGPLGSTASRSDNKGLVSRRWSRKVLNSVANTDEQPKVHAA